MLPELPLLPLQVSEIMSTLLTLNVFSDPEAFPVEEDEVDELELPMLPPLSQFPFSATSCPT
jgi:hypothetical protein